MRRAAALSPLLVLFAGPAFADIPPQELPGGSRSAAFGSWIGYVGVGIVVGGVIAAILLIRAARARAAAAELAAAAAPAATPAGSPPHA